MPKPASTQRLWFLNTDVEIQCSYADNRDGISVLLLTLPKDDAPPLHVHRDEDEIFHIIEGEVRYLIGGQVVIGRAGQTVLAPQGIPHGFRVVSEGARVLVVTRGGFERLVRSFGRPAETDGPPPWTDLTPASQAALVTACAAQRIDILGPPID